jgi:hypothetical protein
VELAHEILEQQSSTAAGRRFIVPIPQPQIV